MRKEAPTAKEFVQKAEGTRLLRNQAATLTRKEGSLSVVPAKIPKLRSLEDLENGQLVAIVEQKKGEGVAAAAGESKSPGSTIQVTRVLVAKVGGAWRVYTECEGKVTEQREKTRLEHHPWGEEKVQPIHLTDGQPEAAGANLIAIPICWSVCIVSVFGFCVLSIPVCIWIWI